MDSRYSVSVHERAKRGSVLRLAKLPMESSGTISNSGNDHCQI